MAEKKQVFFLEFSFLGTNLLQKLKNPQKLNLHVFDHINDRLQPQPTCSRDLTKIDPNVPFTDVNEVFKESKT